MLSPLHNWTFFITPDLDGPPKHKLSDIIGVSIFTNQMLFLSPNYQLSTHCRELKALVTISEKSPAALVLS